MRSARPRLRVTNFVLGAHSRFGTLIRGGVLGQSRFSNADSGASIADPRDVGCAMRDARWVIRDARSPPLRAGNRMRGSGRIEPFRNVSNRISAGEGAVDRAAGRVVADGAGTGHGGDSLALSVGR